jgi:hypothetical protein
MMVNMGRSALREGAGVRVVAFAVDDAMFAGCVAAGVTECVRVDLVERACDAADDASTSWARGAAVAGGWAPVHVPSMYAERLQEEGEMGQFYRLLALAKLVLLRQTLARAAYALEPSAVLYVDPDVVWTGRGGCVAEIVDGWRGGLLVQEKHTQMAMASVRVGSGVMGAATDDAAAAWLLRAPYVGLADHGLTDEETLELRATDVQRTQGRRLVLDAHPLASTGDIAPFDEDFGSHSTVRRRLPQGVDTLSDLWEDASIAPLPLETSGRRIPDPMRPLWESLRKDRPATASASPPSLSDPPSPHVSSNGSEPSVLRILSPLLAPTWLTWAVARLASAQPLRVPSAALIESNPYLDFRHNLRDIVKHTPALLDAAREWERPVDAQLPLYTREPLCLSPNAALRPLPHPEDTEIGNSFLFLAQSSLVHYSPVTDPALFHLTAWMTAHSTRKWPTGMWSQEGWQAMRDCACLVHYNFLPPGRRHKTAAMVLDFGEFKS